MEDQDNTGKRDGVIWVDNCLGNTTPIHEYSPGGVSVGQNIVSIDGAQLGMMARDPWIVDHQIIIEHAPDVYDRLVEWIAFYTLHEKNGVWRDAILQGDVVQLFIHALIIIPILYTSILCNHPVLFVEAGRITRRRMEGRLREDYEYVIAGSAH